MLIIKIDKTWMVKFFDFETGAPTPKKKRERHFESNLENYKNIYVSRPKKKRETPKKWRIVCVNLRKARVA